MPDFDLAANICLERRSADERLADQFGRLRDLVAGAQSTSPYYRSTLAGIDAITLQTRRDLETLPVLYKSGLIDLQRQAPPFGGLTELTANDMRRLFLSPGPICEPQERSVSGPDAWRMSRALNAAGFEAGDRVLNCFSYHITPAGFMLDDGAAALGCAVFPGGVGNTETQVQAIQRFQLNAYTGTPDFLKIIMERGTELDADISSMSKALVTGGPLFPHLRDWYADQGVLTRQCYGSAELGLVAYEGAGPSDGMVVDEDVIVEIVRPGSGDQVEPGEVGEVVVTHFNRHYPLIRLATGDLSAELPGDCPSGRTNMRLKGWMGRADQTTKVRGMFVHPRQIADTLARFPEISKGRLVVSEVRGKDEMRLLCETTQPDAGLPGKVEEALRIATRLRGAVELVEPGDLANDGKVIDDTRPATS